MKIEDYYYQCRRGILDFFLSCDFKLKNKEKQEELLAENAKKFWEYQSIAKHWSEQGDLRESFEWSSQSYKYLGNFALYCDILGLDQVEKLNQYEVTNE